MKFRTTLILAIALIGVSVLFFIATRDTSTTGANGSGETTGANSGNRKLFDVKADDVDHLTIRSAEGATLDVTKSLGEWKLVSPVNWPADPSQVRELVSAIVDLRSHGQVGQEDSNSAATGLDHPRYTIDASGNSKTIKLTIGAHTALGNDLYVKAGDANQADLVPAGVLGTKLSAGKSMEKLVDSIRNKKLLSIAAMQVQQLTVEHHAPVMVLHRTVGAIPDEWKLTAPTAIAADTGEVNSLLDSVTGLEASEFSTESAAQDAGAQFDHPRATVWLSTEAAAAPPTTDPASAGPAHPHVPPQKPSAGVTILIGQPVDIQAEKTWVKVSSPDRGTVVAQAAFTKVSFDNLKSSSPLTLRDKNVLTIDPTKVSSFTVAINKPATTQPTTQPAELRQFTIEHRKAPVLGPILAPVPATKPAASSAAPAIPARETTTLETDSDSLPASACGPATRPSSAATTQPTTQPAGEPATTKAAVPATQPAVATTQPSSSETNPAAATTEPGTLSTPAVSTSPGSPWIFTSGGQGDAEEGQVKELLDALHPLHINKYIEPDSGKGATYTLTVHTIPAKASENAGEFVITLVDTGTKIVGTYQDLHFEIDRAFLEKLTGDFKTKKAPPPPAAPPSRFPGQGGQGFPFGQQ